MNKADTLTGVPQRWLNRAQKGSEPLQQPCAAIVHSLDSERIMSIHRQCGHLGIKRTQYFARMVNPAVDKTDVRMVVKMCKACQTTDPAPVQWKKGQLGASKDGKGWEWISPTTAATTSSPLSTVGLHFLWFGSLLNGRTHPALFASYRQYFSNEGHRRRY